MSIPKSGVWQGLRERALTVVPRSVRAQRGSPSGLVDWSLRGSYSVISMSRKNIEFDASESEIGCALLQDAERLLDHAMEQKTHLQTQCGLLDWSCGAWTAVTVYYWAFFSGLAIGRLLGRSMWRVGDEPVRRFGGIAPAGAGSPGKGAFRLAVKSGTTMGRCAVSLKKDGSRFHDGMWRDLFGLLDAHYRDAGATPPRTEEDRFYSVLKDAVDAYGGDWPSAVRNRINYVPGAAYDQIRGGSGTGLPRWLKLKSPCSFEDSLRHFEDCMGGVGGRRPEADVALGAQLLGCLAFMLGALAEALHDELVLGNGLDRRDQERRSRFALTRGVGDESACWVVAGG